MTRQPRFLGVAERPASMLPRAVGIERVSALEMDVRLFVRESRRIGAVDCVRGLSRLDVSV
jgi:hypothetical protein